MTKDIVELLPCPFCGGTPKILNDPGLAMYIRCMSCGIDNNRQLQTEAQAVAAWNRRSPAALNERGEGATTVKTYEGPLKRAHEEWKAEQGPTPIHALKEKP